LGQGEAAAGPPGCEPRIQLPSRPCGHRSEERGQTLMRLGCPSESPERQIAPYGLNAIPFAVSTTCGLSLPHLMAFSRGEPRIACNRRRPLLSRTYPPLQGLAETSPSARAASRPVLTGTPADFRRPTTLLGFLPLQRLRDRGSVPGRACRSRSVPPSAFLTLSAALSPRTFRACFIPVTLMGFRLQGFSLARIRSPLGVVPLLPFPPVTRG
jgi:hypothetical protein